VFPSHRLAPHALTRMADGPASRPATGLLAAAMAIATLAAVMTAFVPRPAGAQSYASLDVPDSLLVPALQAQSATWEKTWDDLFVAHLRAALAGADSAARLGALAERLAAAEPGALGSTIAGDALALASRWSRAQQRSRVRATDLEVQATEAQRARDYGRADSLFVMALERYQALGERRRAAWVMGSRGVVAFSARDYEGAEARYREALVARQAIGDPQLVGNTLNALGLTNYILRRYDDATAFFREAFRVREASGQLAALGSTMNYLGLTYVARGLPDSADASYRRALELTVSQGDSARTLEVLVNHAILLAQRGALGEAATGHERALVIARERGDQRREALIEGNLADLLRDLGHYSEARIHFERSVALRESDGDLPALATSLIGLGRIGLAMRDPEAARPPLLRAVDLADSLGIAALQASALNNLAIAAGLAGDPTGALQAVNRALDVALAAGDSVLVHDVAVTRGDLALRAGDLDAALAWRMRAAVAGRSLPPQYSKVLASHAADTLALAEALQLSGRLDEAEGLNRRVAELAREIQSPDLEWAAINQLGDIEERRGDLPAALRYERQAALQLDTLRTRQQAESPAIRVFAGRVFTTEALIHLLGRAAALYPDSAFGEEAFLWAERARARALLDVVSDADGAADRPGAEPVTLAGAQRLLDGPEAMAVYSLGDSSSTLWLLRARRWERYTLPPRAQIQPRVQILRRALARPDRAESGAAVRASRALYDMLLGSAQEAMKGVKRLVVIPDGPLALVPFEALLVRDPAPDRAPDPADYLISRMTVSYAPSATLLALRSGAATARGPVVLVGAPDFGVSPLDPLPQAAAELAAVQALVPERDRIVLEGAAATREAVLGLPALGDARVLHIATHGETDEIEPGRSRLWLACDAPGEPATQLTAHDVAALKLRAAQVTLSACETGLGRLERGEGVVGLSRAFLAAGAQSLVVSLWRVNDASTAALMSDFYREVLAKGTRRDEGLARAKRRLLAEEATRSPFYWAPFVLLGNMGPMR